MVLRPHLRGGGWHLGVVGNNRMRDCVGKLRDLQIDISGATEVITVQLDEFVQ